MNPLELNGPFNQFVFVSQGFAFFGVTFNQTGVLFENLTHDFLIPGILVGGEGNIVSVIVHALGENCKFTLHAL